MSDQQQPTEVPGTLNSFLAGLAKQVDERIDRRDAIKGTSLHNNRSRSFQDGYAQGLQGAARSLRAAGGHLFASKDKRIEELEGELEVARAENVKLRQQWGEDASPAMAVDEIEALTERAEAAEQRLEEAREALKDLLRCCPAWMRGHYEGGEPKSPAYQRTQAFLATLDSSQERAEGEVTVVDCGCQAPASVGDDGICSGCGAQVVRVQDGTEGE